MACTRARFPATRRLTTSENSHDRKKRERGHITKNYLMEHEQQTVHTLCAACSPFGARMCLNRQQMPHTHTQQQPAAGSRGSGVAVALPSNVYSIVNGSAEIPFFTAF